MLQNIKTRKRLTQILISVLCLCLAFGAVWLIADSVPKVGAASANVNVNSVSAWNTAMNRSEDTLNITLTGNVSQTGLDGAKLAAVPSGKTVNLHTGNYSITWTYDVENGGHYLAESYTEDSYANGKFWGLLTNKGTLNIDGNGTIQLLIVNRNDKIGSAKNVYVQRGASIVNEGTLNINSGVKVNTYMSYLNSDSTSSTTAIQTVRASVYIAAIANTNTVNINGASIKAGTLVSTSQPATHSTSHSTAFAYGIFGGMINVNGGTIDVDAYSGGYRPGKIIGISGCKEDAHRVAYATGIYSDQGSGIKVLGSTTINANVRNWMGHDSDDDQWGSSGACMAMATGVMYKSNANSFPVVGGGVSINCSSDMASNITIPGTEYYYDKLSNDDSAKHCWRNTFAIAEVSTNVNNIQYHTSDKYYTSDNTGFFGKLTQGYGSNGAPTQLNTSPGDDAMFNMAISNKYIAEEAYLNGQTSGTNVSSASKANATSSKSNGSEMIRSSFTGGGVEGSGGTTQYVTCYRFFNNMTDNNPTPTAVYFGTGSSDYVSTRASYRTGSANGSLVYGAADAGATLYVSGGDLRNPRYYSLAHKTYELAGNFGDRSKTDVNYWRANTKGTTNTLTNTVTLPSNNNVLIIYFNYVKQPSHGSYIYAGPAGKYTATSILAETDEHAQRYTPETVEVAYTGRPVEVGTTFDYYLFDDGGTQASTSPTDDTVISRNAGADSIQYFNAAGTAIAAPTNAGEYRVRITKNADTNYSATSSNVSGSTAEFTLRIVKADPSVIVTNNGLSVTYGQTVQYYVNTFVNFNQQSFPATTGTYTVENPDAYLNASDANQIIRVHWAPAAIDANNFNEKDLEIQIKVNKANLYLKAKNVTTTYGTEAVFEPDIDSNSGLSANDSENYRNWSYNWQVKRSDSTVYQDYAVTMGAGTYGLQINGTPTGTNTNNYNIYVNKVNATTDANASLVIEKANIAYTATPTNREYDGTNTVEVVLTRDGMPALASETAPDRIVTTGTVDNASVGNGKTVRVNIDAATAQYAAFFNNYNLVLSNNPTVDITGKTVRVTVTAKQPTRTYGELANIGVLTEDDLNINIQTEGVNGTFTWNTPSQVPDCATTVYYGTFTPNSSDYSPTEVGVAIQINKAPVTVTPANASVEYGSAVPTIALNYQGFKYGQTAATAANANLSARAATYTPGAPVGNYPISVTGTITADNYEFTFGESVLTVTKKAAVVKVNNAEITYGDALPTYGMEQLTVTGLREGDQLTGTLRVYAPDYTQTSSTGTYDLVAEGLANSNYTVTYQNGFLTVNPATLTIEPVVPADVYTYGHAVPTFGYTYPDLSQFKNSDTAANVQPVVNYNTNYVAAGGTYSPAGVYEVSITSVTQPNPNYAIVIGGKANFTVGKASPVQSEAPIISMTIGQTLAEANIAGGKFINPNVASLTVSGALEFVDAAYAPTATGSFHDKVLRFTPADQENYNVVTVTDNYYNVDPAKVSGKPVITGAPMVGEVLTLDLSALVPQGEGFYNNYQWYYATTNGEVDRSAGVLGYGDQFTVRAADIGKRIIAVVNLVPNTGYTSDDSYAGVNYVASVPTSQILESYANVVRQSDLNYVAPYALSTVYDGAEHGYADGSITVAVDAADITREITIRYNGSTEKPVKVGSYRVTVDVGAPYRNGSIVAGESGVYGPASGIYLGEISISKATYAVTVDPADKVYDASVKATVDNMTITGKVGSDDVALADGYSFTFTDANAGANKAVVGNGLRLTGADAYNYELVVNVGYATISKATLYAKAMPVSRDYDLDNYTVDVRFVNVTGYVGSDGSNTVYLPDGRATIDSYFAGSRVMLEVYWNLAGSSAANYTAEIDISEPVVINKATPVFPQLTLSAIQYNKDRNLGNIAAIYNNKMSTPDGTYTFKNPSLVPSAGTQQRFPATYTPSDSENYKSVDTYITLTVSKKSVIVSAEAADVTYGDPVPAFTATAKGFTGDDTLDNIGGYVDMQTVYNPGDEEHNGVGFYEIIVVTAALDSTNYEYTADYGSFYVEQRAINVTASVTGKVYNGDDEIRVTFSMQPDAVAQRDRIGLAQSVVTGHTASANAGTWVVTYAEPSLTGDKAANYYVVMADGTESGILQAEITKADYTGVVFPRSASLGLGLTLARAEFDDPGTGEGSFAYELATEKPAAMGVYNNYYVVFTPYDTNYNTRRQIVRLTVTQQKVDGIRVTIAGEPKTGKTLVAALLNVTGDAKAYLKYQWYRVDKAGNVLTIDGANEVNYTITNDDVDYLIGVAVYFEEDAPFAVGEGAEPFYANGETVQAICNETSDRVSETQLTFWQKFLNWIRRIIAAITGVKLSRG